MCDTEVIWASFRGLKLSEQASTAQVGIWRWVFPGASLSPTTTSCCLWTIMNNTVVRREIAQKRSLRAICNSSRLDPKMLFHVQKSFSTHQRVGFKVCAGTLYEQREAKFKYVHGSEHLRFREPMVTMCESLQVHPFQTVWSSLGQNTVHMCSLFTEKATSWFYPFPFNTRRSLREAHNHFSSSPHNLWGRQGWESAKKTVTDPRLLSWFHVKEWEIQASSPH